MLYFIQNFYLRKEFELFKKTFFFWNLPFFFLRTVVDYSQKIHIGIDILLSVERTNE